MTAAGDHRNPEPLNSRTESINGRRDRRVADDVKTRRHTGLGAGKQVLGDGVGV